LTKTERPNSRQKLLDAATHIVAERGGGKLTLDAVAARAGVSKGGLLYNFPNKQALLTAMVDGMIAHYMQLRESHYNALPASSNRFVKAIVACLLDFSESERQVAQGLLASISEQPDLLRPVRAKLRETIARIGRESEHPERAMLAWLVVEGMWNMDLLTTNPLTDAQRAWVLGAVEDLLDAAEIRPLPTVNEAHQEDGPSER
jgi:AcrR family transcriptional regulator